MTNKKRQGSLVRRISPTQWHGKYNPSTSNFETIAPS
jgi:hypothetical protein